jgi:ketosteroid isomerase-like protein
MSQENVELARAALNAFAELDEGLIDLQRMEEFFAEDVITTFSGFEGFIAKQGTLRGRDDDRVVVIGRLIGTGKESGVEVEQPDARIWTVRDGRIVRGELNYTDRREALEAAGRSE